MSALDALRTSVSGMNAQSAKLSGISNNIANSSTVGYKRVDTQFEGLVLAGSSTSKPIMAGTTAHDRVQISKAGQVQSTTNATDVAVNGDGYLIVNEKADSNGKYLATRAGSFRPDQYGNLVNTAGYYLQGVPVDATGVPTGLGTNLESLQSVNINNVTVASAPTTNMTLWANLNADSAPATTPTEVTLNTFTSSVNYYDPLGGEQTMTYKFVPTATNDAWTLYVFDGADSATDVTDNTTAKVSVDLVFNGTADPNPGTLKTGTATTVPDATSYDAATGLLTVPTAGGNVSVNIGAVDSTSGITQMSGDSTETKIEKDGSAFGLLQGVSVQNDGLVMATFSNGKTRPIYQLKLAVLPNADGMTPVRGDAFEMSAAAGAVRLLNPGSGSAGTTAGNALEASNVDMGTELTNLIETQRAYSSNATVIRTSDQMLQEANDLKR